MFPLTASILGKQEMTLDDLYSMPRLTDTNLGEWFLYFSSIVVIDDHGQKHLVGGYVGKSTATGCGGHRLRRYEAALHYIKLQVWATGILSEYHVGALASAHEVEARIWRTEPLPFDHPEYKRLLTQVALFEGLTVDLLQTLCLGECVAVDNIGYTPGGVHLADMQDLYKDSTASAKYKVPYAGVNKDKSPQNRHLGRFAEFEQDGLCALCPQTYNHIKKIGLSYTFVDVGWWYRIAWPRLPSGKLDHLSFHPELHLAGTGDVPSALTDLRDVGRYFAKLVRDDRTANKYVLVYNELWTQNQIWDTLSRISGEKIPKTYDSAAQLEDTIASAKKAMEAGETGQSTMLGLIGAQYEYSR